MEARARSEQIRSVLEDEILQGKLTPGMRLDEQALAQRFNVSRTPVREAISHLASSGLVQIRHRQGAVVVALTIPQLIEIFEVMAELEGLCARLAARRSTEEDRRALQSAHESCLERAKAADPEGFYLENKGFHEIIYAASRNAFLEENTRTLRNRVGPYRRYITYQPGRMTDSIAEHEAVMNAILAHDGAKAQALMRGHVNLLGEHLADFISALPSTIIGSERRSAAPPLVWSAGDVTLGADRAGEAQ